MEFHGTLGAQISLTRAVPWNSMEFRVRQFRWHEQFHGFPWNLKCANFADMRSSMEFHGNLGAPISLTRAVLWNSMELRVRQFRWHEQFHGIPWNLKSANFADMHLYIWYINAYVYICVYIYIFIYIYVFIYIHSLQKIYEHQYIFYVGTMPVIHVFKKNILSW